MLCTRVSLVPPLRPQPIMNLPAMEERGGLFLQVTQLKQLKSKQLQKLEYKEGVEGLVQGGPGGRVMLGQHELQQELAQGDFGEQVLDMPVMHDDHDHHHDRHRHHRHHRAQVMAWRGLQALSGGTLADMFPPMDRGMGMGMGGGQVQVQIK